MPTSGESDRPAARARRSGQRPRPRRYEPTPVYAIAERLKHQGLELQTCEGPWRPLRRRLRRPGRNGERALPVVTNGDVEIAVDTAEHAVDLAGFLNAAGVHHLEPVANLRPPRDDLADH